MTRHDMTTLSSGTSFASIINSKIDRLKLELIDVKSMINDMLIDDECDVDTLEAVSEFLRQQIRAKLVETGKSESLDKVSSKRSVRDCIKVGETQNTVVGKERLSIYDRKNHKKMHSIGSVVTDADLVRSEQKERNYSHRKKTSLRPAGILKHHSTAETGKSLYSSNESGKPKSQTKSTSQKKVAFLSPRKQPLTAPSSARDLEKKESKLSRISLEPSLQSLQALKKKKSQPSSTRKSPSLLDLPIFQKFTTHYSTASQSLVRSAIWNEIDDHFTKSSKNS